MMASYFYIFLVLGIGSRSVYSNSCRIPLRPQPFPLDPMSMLGTWYEYMNNLKGIKHINAVHHYAPISCFNDKDSLYLGVAVEWRVSFNLQDATHDKTCLAEFGAANLTANGRMTGRGLIIGIPEPVPVEATILYTDPISFQLYYVCLAPNVAEDSCDMPVFLVLTRNRPADLTVEEKAYIQQNVDRALSRFCFSTSNMTPSMEDFTLPVCWPTPPKKLDDITENFHFGSCYSIAGPLQGRKPRLSI